MQHTRILRWSAIVILGLMALEGGIRLSTAADDATPSGKAKSRSNRLAKETSPYLLMHAQNPVDWYPWGPEALEKAKKEEKLIFLSIGYSSCYWCHVMERKVFLNEAIAKTLNKDFICIKVDREERPDLDDIYMTALQVYFQIIGSPSSGGWPLSIFLTPDGKPVAGGTYFPPEDQDGHEGFPTVLAKLTDLWKTKREQMTTNAEVLTKETRRVMRPKVSLTPIEIKQDHSQKVFDSLVTSFDPEFGGIDFNGRRPDGPKFPTPAKLIFLQRSVDHTSNDDVAKMMELTLMQMACGGIRDHIGGGFHRYSVDRRWNVPHFEKMLYDQAQLADVYVNAYRTTERPLYKQVAEELFDFVGRELTSPEGGFYSALDAETNGVEGEYYVWDATEIENILGTSAKSFKEAYRVKDLPDFEEGNVLRLSLKRLPKPGRSNVITNTASLDGSEADEFSLSRQKLLDVRGKRKKPLRDEKMLTCWNGLMIGAYARAANVLKHPEYARTAERAAGFLLDKLRDPQGRLLHCYTSGQAKLNAYLDDYAFLIDGLLALHEATDDPRWLKAAKQLQDDQIRSFLDQDHGGFFFTSRNHEKLLADTKNCYDGVIPAGNSISAQNLIKLAKRTGKDVYREEARATIELFVPNIDQAPRGHANLALAVMEFLEPAEVKEDAGNKKEVSEVIPAGGTDTKKSSTEPLIILAEQKDEKPKKDEYVKARVYLSTDKLPAGSTCEFIVLLNVEENWHLNANPPSPDTQIPVKVSFKSKLGAKLSEPKYPEGHVFQFKDDPTEIMAYEGEIAIRGTVTVPEKAGGQTDEMDIIIDYQACHKDGKCLPPKAIKLKGKLGVAKKGETVKSINARLFPPAEKTEK